MMLFMLNCPNIQTQRLGTIGHGFEDWNGIGEENGNEDMSS